MDDLAVTALCEEEVIRKLYLWKKGLERKGLMVNLSKTKLMVGGERHNMLRNVGKWVCAICGKDKGCNSIQSTRSMLCSISNTCT